MRTALTVTGAAVAMFVFCFVGSVQEGLDRLTSDPDANRSLIVFQENRFCPASSQLPVDYEAVIEKIDGVAEVVPIQVWTNNCRASLDIVVFHGADPAQIKATRPLTIVAGEWKDFESRRDSALVGKNIAVRRRLKLGDQFTIGEISVKVAAIFESPISAEENLIYTSLEFLQYTQGAGAAGVVTQHEVLIQPDADPDQVALAIDDALRSAAVPTKTRRKGVFQTSTLSDLVDLIGFAHYLGYACVGLVLALVATTTIMSVQDRVQEYAVLQTIGFGPGKIAGLVVAESTFLCLLGGAVGISLAFACLFFGGFSVGAEGATIAFDATLQLGSTAIIVSLAVGLISGLVPALQAARVSIVTALSRA